MTDAAATTSDGPDARRVVIAPLTTAHLDRVLEIESQVATPGWSRGIFERELAADTGRCYLVALHVGDPEDVVVGYAGVQMLAEVAHVTTMAVSPHARRRGIAGRLLTGLLRAARERGATSATLEVRVDNGAARALYAGYGFRPVGVRPRYYDGTVDALIMWAHDLDGPGFDRLLRRVPTDGRH